ncbi:cyclic nucleotide-binding domain-containing protein [Futiania mangrovi]|uniref:Cyclic nucleotide-binding domain-containing protein n=1 Tax=Futiania mangrovi TaxID=2959716 RepID=A0A9J6PFL9_9PROT|nr:cyclic nucleotide-binding domain-containing protein [Futiania mangrovii]MCP1336595.1 cyclic nucleotide-binding domain-containing protein [Futiania mangrovii]
MRQADFEDVRHLPLFEDMSDGSFAQLVRGAYVQTFPPAIELVTEGDSPDFLHIVLEGMVELFATWNRRETTMATLGPMATFILAATIRDAPYLMSARTLEKSRIVLLPSEDVRTVFQADNAFARSVVTELAACYRAVVKNSKDLRLRNSVERLANYVLRHLDRSADAREFTLPIEKRRLAAYLGMTPENLSRAIRTLGPYGVEVDGNRVIVRDRTDLLKLAKPTPLIDDPAH